MQKHKLENKINKNREKKSKKSTNIQINWIRNNKKSGRMDLNHRPLGPEPSALAPALLPENRFDYKLNNISSQ